MVRRVTMTTIMVSLALIAAGVVAGEEDIEIAAMAACKTEIDSYCSQVTPGEGRLLACFYAHGDKISGRCEWGLYKAAADLEEFVAALAHVASQCEKDLIERCGEVEMGEGRVAKCLLKHKAELTEACREAIDDVGLELAE